MQTQPSKTYHDEQLSYDDSNLVIGRVNRMYNTMKDSLGTYT